MPSSSWPLPNTHPHIDRKQPLFTSSKISQHSSLYHVPSGSLKYIWISLKSSGNYASASCDLLPFITTFSEIIQLDILERFGVNQTSRSEVNLFPKVQSKVISVHESHSSKILTKHIVGGKYLLSTSAMTSKISQVYQKISFHLQLLKVEWLRVIKPLIGRSGDDVHSSKCNLCCLDNKMQKGAWDSGTAPPPCLKPWPLAFFRIQLPDQ